MKSRASQGVADPQAVLDISIKSHKSSSLRRIEIGHMSHVLISSIPYVIYLYPLGCLFP